MYIFDHKSTENKKPSYVWNKSLIDQILLVSYKGAKAQLTWNKCNELIILKGVILSEQVPYNKDGSLSIAAKFTKALRDQHQDKISNFTTTSDVMLKSPNEVGHFLYYAGANSWEIIYTNNNQTLEEICLVKK